jgi:glycosyltransferase involved in cell wall biosynthesis
MNARKGVEAANDAARGAGLPLKLAAKMSEPAEVAYFEQRVRALLGPEVEFLGEVGGIDKLDLLGGASCLLNPVAWHEPFGMVVVEALACGTPVVATPFGSMPELVDEGVTGFLRSDVASLAAALVEVPSLDRAACRHAAETRFSAHRMAAEHVALYRSIVARDGMRHPPAAA